MANLLYNLNVLWKVDRIKLTREAVMAVAITLGGITYEDVKPLDDTSTDEALRFAREIAGSIDMDIVTDAIIDGRDGLVVLYGDRVDPTPDFHELRGWHFSSPLCGYGGAGPNASAIILELFGFGNRSEIFQQINHGGEDSNWHFRKA